MTKAMVDKEIELEAQKRLETEAMHEADEAESRALCQGMMADAKKNRPTFNSSCLKVLNNFQGIFY